MLKTKFQGCSSTCSNHVNHTGSNHLNQAGDSCLLHRPFEFTGQRRKILSRANKNEIKCFDFGSIKRASRPHFRTIKGEV